MDELFGNPDFTIHAYGLDQTVADCVVVKVFEHRWPHLSNGKSTLATSAIHGELSEAALIEIWNEYVVWVKTIQATLPEENQMFATTMNGKTVWVLCIHHPSQY